MDGEEGSDLRALFGACVSRPLRIVLCCRLAEGGVLVTALQLDCISNVSISLRHVTTRNCSGESVGLELLAFNTTDSNVVVHDVQARDSVLQGKCWVYLRVSVRLQGRRVG